jgi:hypothetical protein
MSENTDSRKKKFLVTLNGEDKTAELHEFSCAIGLEAAAPDRYSTLLVLHLFGGFASQALNPAKVMHEIKALEGTGNSSIMKPPIPFKPPLKGLLHKHYLPVGRTAMVRNLLNGLRKDGLPWFEQRVREAQTEGVEWFVTPEDINAITHDAVTGNWTRRAGAREMTGEWVVYAQHEGANYYLCLGEHKEDKRHLRAQIEAVCFPEFPFLAKLLA